MENLPLPQSNVQWHAALTHFPITLLFVAVFFDLVALFYKRPALREFSLWMLTLCVISLPFSLLSGWLTGREFKRAPVGYDSHWQAAVITTVLAAILLAWRLGTKDKMPRAARVCVLTLTMACAMGVGYTGHQGGEMTFGGREAPVEVADNPTSATPNSDQQIALAAGKMAVAAVKLDQSTERALMAAQNQKAPPAPAPPPNVIVKPNINAVPPDSLNEAARTLNDVAARFEQTAGKMERIAKTLESSSSRLASAPRPAGGSGGPTVKVDGGSSGNKPTPATTPPKSDLDPKLIAAGKKSFFDENNGCLDCHAMDGKGRAKNGDLTHIGSKPYDVEWHIAHLKDPKSKVPGSKMPAYDDLPESELRALAVYMVSKK